MHFPSLANGPLIVRDASSDIEVRARLKGAREVPGVMLDGVLAFVQATAQGHTVFQRQRDSGVEDYIAFEQRPDRPVIEYELELSSSIAGLRLVANTLELLDSGGTPRLRASPPYILGADDALTWARIEVTGCAVDRDPSAPWGRPPIAPGASACDVTVRWDDAHVVYPALLDPAWT